MTYFLYKFVPRPDFPESMTSAEAATMGEHVAYWRGLLNKGTAVAFGPVADPAGAWGVAILEADSLQDVQEIREADPVVLAGIGPVDIYPMADAVARPWQRDPHGLSA